MTGPQTKSRRKLLATGILAIVTLAAGSSIAWWLSSRRANRGATAVVPGSGGVRKTIVLPPVESPADQLIKFASSHDFEMLSPDKQAAYVKTLRDPRRFGEYVQMYFDGKITLQDGERAMGNVATAILIQQSKEYAALKSPEQRLALLDKAIDEKNQAEASLQLMLRLGGFGKLMGSAGGPQSVSPLEVKEWVENLSPQERQDYTEYLRAIGERIRHRPGE